MHSSQLNRCVVHRVTVAVCSFIPNSCLAAHGIPPGSDESETIPVGSLVVSHKVDPRRLGVGDVISFEKPIGAKGIDTHRIVAIKNDKGKRLYQTKGDSNPVVDPWVITFEPGTTAHRMAFSLPYAGNALLFARSPLGRLSLIGYVCLILLLSIFKGIAATAKDKTQLPRVPSAVP